MRGHPLSWNLVEQKFQNPSEFWFCAELLLNLYTKFGMIISTESKVTGIFRSKSMKIVTGWGAQGYRVVIFWEVRVQRVKKVDVVFNVLTNEIHDKNFPRLRVFKNKEKNSSIQMDTARRH